MIDVRGKRVTVIGAARSGIAAANVLCALGAHVKISDSQSLVAIESHLQYLNNRSDVIIESGGHTQSFIESNDIIIMSPGVPYHALPYQWARSKKIRVISEIEFAFLLCPCPIVAVTGTNGKTTTVTLISRILKEAGRSVCVCGNIGESFSSFVLGLKSTDIVVLEVSSFQLQATEQFRPHVGLWTNFSENHLNQHKNIEEYYQAKCKLFVNQNTDDVAILNAKQAEHVALAKTLKARVSFFNTVHDPKEIENPNFLAALHVARALNIDESICWKVFASFTGVEHRLEFIRTINGVDYINDSKSTTVEAGRWALERIHKPIILIAGGSDKNLDYAPLRQLMKIKTKHIIAFGQISLIIKDTFHDIVPVTVATSLKSALELSKQNSIKGDCILLSPMTASFDMFNDYEHRGKVFKEMVNAL